MFALALSTSQHCVSLHVGLLLLHVKLQLEVLTERVRAGAVYLAAVLLFCLGLPLLQVKLLSGVLTQLVRAGAVYLAAVV